MAACPARQCHLRQRLDAARDESGFRGFSDSKMRCRDWRGFGEEEGELGILGLQSSIHSPRARASTRFGWSGRAGIVCPDPLRRFWCATPSRANRSLACFPWFAGNLQGNRNLRAFRRSVALAGIPAIGPISNQNSLLVEQGISCAVAGKGLRRIRDWLQGKQRM